MIRYYFRHNWAAITNLKRNFLMTFASISLVAITLTIVGIFATSLLNIQKMASDVEKNVLINVYLQVDSQDSQETITNLDSTISANPDYHKLYDAIAALDGVKSVTYSSKDQELDKLKETYGDDWQLTDGDANPLLDVYVVETDQASDVKPVSEDIKTMAGVDSVSFGGTDSEQLFKVARYIRIGGLVGTLILVIFALFVISNTIRMTIMSRQRDIEIMRLVGAKNSYIRGPFFYEGAWVGLLGSILPSLIVYFLYLYVYKALGPGLATENINLYSPYLSLNFEKDFFMPLLIGGMVLSGILIGSFGAVNAMRRYLKF